MSAARNHADDLRGATRLAVDATTGITRVVREMHRTIASGPPILGRPLARPATALTRLVYAPILGVTGLVGASLDRILAQLAPLLGEGAPGVERDAIVAALNGVLGDHLLATKNPLATTMALRKPRPLAEATSKIVVLIHGSSMNERQWLRAGHDHGAALADDLGFTPVYVRYNTGLHISTNGRSLAAELEALVATWPVAVDELVLVGHSMGGLVARSACHAGAGSSWLPKLRRLVTLGTPHHGSPLERGGNLADVLLGISAYSAPLAKLGQIRSAGVTDLRYGNILDEDWADRGRFAPSGDVRRGVALPAGVECFAIAGTTAAAHGAKLPGDGLVPVDSALGRHPRLDLGFTTERQWIALGTPHLDLLGSKAVYEQLRSWLGSSEPLDTR